MKNDDFTIDLSDSLQYNLEYDDEHTYGDYIDDYEITISVDDNYQRDIFCNEKYSTARNKIKITGLDHIGLHTLEKINKS